jgi:hypothetical protein
MNILFCSKEDTMKKLRKFFIVIILVLSGIILKANNVQIDSVSLVDVTTLRFKISWENSWYTVVPPTNHDAVWIFCKRSYCPSPIVWEHANIATTGHSVGAPLEIYMDGKNNAGLFVRRSSEGYGDLEDIEVRIKLAAPAIPGEYDYRVFAIEMVYIPQGAFYLGDGEVDGNDPKFYSWSAAAPYSPYLVSSNAQINYGTIPGYLYSAGGSSLQPTGNIPASYPKGYNAFYCMKYEISQDQAASFMNHVTLAMHDYWTYAGYTFINSTGSGQLITSSVWQNFSFQYPWRALILNPGCDVRPIQFNQAYLDWAGLRPMTEMEHEKICRGLLYPVLDEFAWATAVVKQFKPTDPEALYYGTPQETHNYTFTSPTQGIVNSKHMNEEVYRCGFANKPNSSRIHSGASYWGVMELTGNSCDWVVSAITTEARNFTDQPGDGILDSQGFANQSTWPPQAWCGQPTHYLMKGGDVYRLITVSHRRTPGEIFTLQLRGVR